MRSGREKSHQPCIKQVSVNYAVAAEKPLFRRNIAKRGKNLFKLASNYIFRRRVFALAHSIKKSVRRPNSVRFGYKSVPYGVIDKLRYSFANHFVPVLFLKN